MVEANVRALNVWSWFSELGALLLRGVSRNSTRSRKSCRLHVGMPEHAAKDAEWAAFLTRFVGYCLLHVKSIDSLHASAQDADGFSAQDADGFSAKYAGDSSTKDADDFSAQDAGDSSAGAGALPGVRAAHGRPRALHSGPTAETKVK